MAKHHRRGARGVTIFAIKNALPLDLPKADLPIGPYTLGLWLGDGHHDSRRITQHPLDVETAEFVRDEGYPVEIATDRCGNLVYTFGSIGPRRWAPVARAMVALGLRGAGNAEARKHIPPIYQRAGQAQRLALLQGLMDSDGTILANGRAEFTNTNLELAAGVYELVVGLGMKASLSTRAPQRAGCLLQTRVNFKPSPGINPFRLRRKADRVLTPAKPSITFRRRVVGVEKIDSVPTQCIQVDAPDHLYLCGRQMVPTHNTTLLTGAIASHVVNEPAPILGAAAHRGRLPQFHRLRSGADLRRDPNRSGHAGDGGRRDRAQHHPSPSLPGGSLKIVAARSPRNLRAHTVRILLIDEEDGMEVTAEGDAARPSHQADAQLPEPQDHPRLDPDRRRHLDDLPGVRRQRPAHLPDALRRLRR